MVHPPDWVWVWGFPPVWSWPGPTSLSSSHLLTSGSVLLSRLSLVSPPLLLLLRSHSRSLPHPQEMPSLSRSFSKRGCGLDWKCNNGRTELIWPVSVLSAQLIWVDCVVFVTESAVRQLLYRPPTRRLQGAGQKQPAPRRYWILKKILIYKVLILPSCSLATTLSKIGAIFHFFEQAINHIFLYKPSVMRR